jgi:chromate transporter
MNALRSWVLKLKNNKLKGLETKKIRYIIFLKDVLILSLTCFGGPQAHLTLFVQRLVQKHRYVTEAEMMEMYALCQLLPGPTSTQTITAIGFKLGKARLAYLTLLVWVFPATLAMGAMALGVSFVDPKIFGHLTQFLKPMGVAFILYAAFSIGRKVIDTKTSFVLLFLAAFTGFWFPSPFLTPVLLVVGGLVTSAKYNKQKKMLQNPVKIKWANFVIWAAIFVVTALLGKLTHSLPIRLFENFYRNGSLAFGGGHILKPLLFNEFVEFKHYLSADEFLSGISLAEAVPGPTFSIASYVGSLSMRSWGVYGQIGGSIIASVGIFLPGILMIFFVIRFWEQLKQFRGVRASLEGINATSTGLTLAAGLSLFQPLYHQPINVFTIIFTFLLLITRKVPAYFIIFGALLLGSWLK